MPVPYGTVAEIGEAGLLALLRRHLGKPSAGVVAGIGDDAALLESIGPHAVLTADLLVERQDFDFAWATPADVGHKAAAVNLSDLAAMGAAPRCLLVSLALRRRDRVADVLALIRSLARVGRRYGAPLVGGDLSKTRGPMIVAVTAVGEVAAGRAMRRGRARAGDVILVSGTLGGAGLGLMDLRSKRRARSAATRRQLRPEPRIALGLRLARWGRVRACADISDGLAADALHLVAPGNGVEIDPALLPIAESSRAKLGTRAWRTALCGGEDFELAIAVRPGDVAAVKRVARVAGARLTPVGTVCRGRGLRLVGFDLGNRRWVGFDHFK
ncbi:MAG: thiamine-phosphate kinase [Myxococcota bacterium]